MADGDKGKGKLPLVEEQDGEVQMIKIQAEESASSSPSKVRFDEEGSKEKIEKEGSKDQLVQTRSGSIFGTLKLKLGGGSAKELDDETVHKAKSQAGQAKLLRQDKVWKAAREGTVFDFKEAIGDPAKPKVDMLMRGQFGETLLHIACLFANFPVMRYIVEHFPYLINQPYEKEPYTGETALHIAIVQADVDAVKFLLDHGADVNNSRCTGEFFRPPKGKIYLGEHPLTFAACVEREEKNKEMVRLLLRYGASFYNQDVFGNTVLHVLVIKEKPDMYKFIMDLFELYTKPGEKNLEDILNKQMRTPINLAASLAKGDLFELINKRKKEILWVYGPMAACAYPLKEIDTYHAGNDRRATSLELVVYLSGQAGNTHESEMDRAALLLKTPMKELVQSKWDIFAKRLFYMWFLTYIAYLIVFSMVVIRPGFLIDSSGEGTIAMTVLEIIVLAYASASVLLETRDLLHLRMKYFTEKGSRFFYLIAWVNSTLIWLAFLFRMTADRESEEICTAIASISAWFYLMYFARGFKNFGFFVVSIREILVRDLSRFIIVYLIILIGFTLSFMVTFRRTALLGFETFQMGLLSTFRMTLFAFDDFDPTVSNSFAYTIITFIIFIFVVSILLLNMLIAMMGDTYARVRESSEMQHTLEWVSIVLLLERRLPFFLRTRYRSGIPSPEIGLDGTDYYLIVEERTDWGESAANRRLRFIFKNAIKRVISALRMRRMLSSDPSKRQQVLEQQQKLLEEEEKRLKEKLDQRIRKRKSNLASGITGMVEGLFSEMGDIADEMSFLRYQDDENIGGAMK